MGESGGNAMSVSFFSNQFNSSIFSVKSLLRLKSQIAFSLSLNLSSFSRFLPDLSLSQPIQKRRKRYVQCIFGSIPSSIFFQIIYLKGR